MRDAARELADGLEPLGLPQPRLQPRVVRDVGRDPADPVELPALVDERELQREEGPRLIAVADLLLELDRLALGHHAQVVDAHALGDVGREDLLVEPADQLGRGPPVQRLERAVDEQVAPVRVLEEDRRRRVVEHGAQRARVGVAQDDELVLAHRGARDVERRGQLTQRLTDRIAPEQRLRALVREHGDA